MDLLSFGFLALVILLGGMIAYFADWLGRKLGKKRISLFGMRPRHTAALFTVGAGVLIPLLTIVIISAASSDVRKWLLEGHKAVQQVQGLRAEVGGLKGERQTLQSENQQTKRTLAKANGQLTKIQTQLTGARSKIAEANKKVAAASANAERLTASVSKLTSRIAQADLKLASRQRELLQKTREIDQVNKNLGRIRLTLKEVNKQRKEADDYNIKLDKQNLVLEKQVTGLQTEINQLGSDKTLLQTDIDQAKREFTLQVRGYKHDLEISALQLDKNRAQLDNLNSALQFVGKQIDRSLTEPMTFQRDEEVSRLQVPAGLSATEAVDSVTRLLRTARVAASNRGAAGQGSNGSAVLAPRRGKDGRELTPEIQEQILIKGITNASEDQVLVASALLNSFKGGPVPLGVQSYPNPVVFRAGSIVAETRVDGTQSDDLVRKQVQAFLTLDVKAAAEHNHLVPINGREASFGTVDFNQLYEVVKQIRATGRRVRLVAYVSDDTRAAGPLNLKFRIR